MLKEFKEFISRGNVVDLAVGVIIGGAFGKIVSSLVSDIIMPLIGIKNELKIGDLEIVPYKGLPIITHWHLVWLASKRLSPIAEAYLEFLQKEKDRIVEQTFSWFEQY